METYWRKFKIKTDGIKLVLGSSCLGVKVLADLLVDKASTRHSQQH